LESSERSEASVKSHVSRLQIVTTDMTDVPATSRRVTELLGTPEGRATLRTVAREE